MGVVIVCLSAHAPLLFKMSLPGMSGDDDELEHDNTGSSNSDSNCNGKRPCGGKYRIAITGGQGFLAQHVAKCLSIKTQERRWPQEWIEAEIHLLDRVDKHAFHLVHDKDDCLKSHRVNILDTTLLDKAFSEIQPHIVIHCAGITEGCKLVDRQEMTRCNVDGTRNVVKACKAHGVTALVYCGSLAQVLTGKADQEGINEDTDDSLGKGELLHDVYGSSKAKGEKIVLDANGTLCGNEKTLHTCSLRLPPLYGENDKTLVPLAISAADKFNGHLPLCGNKSVKITVAYAGNAAWAVVCAAREMSKSTTCKAVGGKFYYITDDSPTACYADFFQQFGIKTTKYVVPANLLLVLVYLMAMLNVLATAIMKIKFPTDVVNYHRLIKILAVSHTVSSRRAKSSLGYRPLYQFEEAKVNSRQYYIRL